MRLIWVKVGGLWPVNTGGRIRSFHMLRELSHRHEVTLLTTHGPSEDPRALEAALPRYEASACARAQLTIAVSDADRHLLAAAAPGARVRAVPTGVDVDYFAPDGVAEIPGRLVFTGSMDWYPNEDGIVHFIDAVLPRIRREVPAAALTVVGRNPSARLRGAAAAAGVHVTGLVDDVRP